VAVRKTRTSDLQSVLDVLRSYHFKLLDPVNGGVVDENFGDIISLRNHACELDLGNAFVAVHGDQVVGFAHYERQGETTVKQTLMSVLPEHHGRGYGVKLQKALMDEAYARGAKKLITATDNPKAKAWYQKKFGFIVIGTEPVRHRLHFLRSGDRIIWGIHYGFPGEKTLSIMSCDLEKFFDGRQKG